MTNARTIRRSAAALVAAAALAFGAAGCAGDDASDDTVHGPNGFDRIGSLEGDVSVWGDRGTESGLTDVIVQGADGGRAGSCLGNAPLMCLQGDVSVGAYVIVIAPTGSTAATLHWTGADIAMTFMDGFDAEGEQVFVAAAPATDPTVATANVTVTDAAGTPTMDQ